MLTSCSAHTGRGNPGQHPAKSRDLSHLPCPVLMQRYANGDEAAFAALYARHAPVLRGFLVSLTRSADLAEDLVQSTFERMHRFRRTYATGAPVLPWLLVIARRCFYDERRGAHARCERLTRTGTVPELPSCDAPCQAELPPDIAAALSALPSAQRDAFLLTKVLGYTGDEAAQETGASRGTIKVRVHRANQALRQVLGQQPCDAPGTRTSVEPKPRGQGHAERG